jgi:hypothetical protein
MISLKPTNEDCTHAHTQGRARAHTHTHTHNLKVKHVMLQKTAMTTVCHHTPPLMAQTITRCALPFTVNSQKYKTLLSSSITQNIITIMMCSLL